MNRTRPCRVRRRGFPSGKWRRLAGRHLSPRRLAGCIWIVRLGLADWLSGCRSRWGKRPLAGMFLAVSGVASGPASQRLGQRGERLAAKYLRRRGMRIVARQERLGVGEIDLIGVERRTLVFVEVKTRTSDNHGRPEEAVTLAKQRRLTRAALVYMRRNDLLECDARFDVLAITWPESQRRPTIHHFRDAFQPDSRFQWFT